jgi:hypothetical protein
MILVSWNSRDLDGKTRVATVKDIIKLERPTILFLQRLK